MLYLTIHKGERADQATAILACSDQRIIRLVLSEIAQFSTGKRSKRREYPTQGFASEANEHGKIIRLVASEEDSNGSTE